MTFPKLSLTTLPPEAEIQYLSDWETNDGTANVCISLWQYAQVLLKLDAAGALNDRVKKALKMLYFKTSPLTADELKDFLKETDRAVINGPHGLGGFAVKFLDQLRNDFPALQFPQPYSGAGGVFWQVILDLMLDKKGGNIHLYLRSRFRAALAQCFGDDTILGW
jgi:hypothetical protein